MTTVPATATQPTAATRPPVGTSSSRSPDAGNPRALDVAAPVPAAPATTAPPPPVRPQAIAQGLEQVQQAIDRLKQSIKPELANTLDFQIDEGSGRTVVKVMDMETDTLIRQIPSEDVLAIVHAIDRMQGRSGLLKQQA